MKTLFLAAAFAASTIGCASVTEDSLEKQSDNKIVSEIGESPATAYRRISLATKKCFAAGGPTVSADYFPDISQGRVAAFLPSTTPGLVRTLATTTISQSPTGGAVITTHYAKRAGFAWLGESTAAWAADQPGQCKW